MGSNVKNVIEKALKENRFPTEAECREVLKEYGIPVLEYGVAHSEKEALEIAKKFGYPVVLKMLNVKGLHKSKVNGVRLDIKSDEEVIKHFNELKSEWGVLISPMVRGFELFVGAFQDEQFGVVVSFGTGGKYVEVYKDVSFRIVPFDRKEVIKMIDETKVSKILKGYRDKKPKNLDAIVDLLLKLSKLMLENPEIKEVDLNPTFIFDDRIAVADARFIL
ncbi:acetyl-CoA synthetase [Archaeoglobales archaeon]|nr:MAG: acetyl-CoA synthetase [Archaeoglobales archaeon]